MIIYLYFYLFSLFCFFQNNCSPIEFLYPVAYNPLQNAVYLIYQKSPESLELWFWNPQTKQAVPGLLSRFTPAGIRILPSGKGFSFVDNGVIKVQSLLKRSPYRIELDRPLHDITLLEWITDEVCYLSAKERAHYGIYQINRDGQVSTLIKKPGLDCLYPQKVNSQLFYIERLHNDGIQQYKIMQVEYKADDVPVEGNQQDLTNKRSVAIEAGASSYCICDLNIPAAFLRMTSQDCGYFVSYSTKVMRTESVIKCDYYQLKRNETGEWSSLRLFSFGLPTDLLFVHKDSRLYESILSLLPRQYGDQIYYNDVLDDGSNLAIWSYNIVKGKKSMLLSSSVAGQDYFVPLLIGNTLYAGGRLLIGLASDSTSDNIFRNNENHFNSLYMEAILNGGVEVGFPTVQHSSPVF